MSAAGWPRSSRTTQQKQKQPQQPEPALTRPWGWAQASQPTAGGRRTAPMDKSLVLAAARLTDQVTEQAQARDAAFREGYELGFQAGYDTGYGAAEHDMATTWAQVAESVRALAGQPSHTELQRRRAE